MTMLAELIPEAKSLSRADKLRLIQLLAEELATAELGVNEGNDIHANQSYAVWSPDQAFSAADVMLRALAEEPRS